LPFTQKLIKTIYKMKTKLLYSLLLSFFCLALHAQEITFVADNGITYTTTSITAPLTVAVREYDATFGTSVVIPTNIMNNGITYAVTSIRQNAFNSKNLTSVTIGDNVTSIESSAFQFNSISSVTIGNSVASIGIAAFANNNLTNISIPNSVTSIEDFAFKFNSLIITVNSLKTNPATISNIVFDDVSNIDLTIPAEASTNYTNAGWTGFKSITEDSTLSTGDTFKAIRYSSINSYHNRL